MKNETVQNLEAVNSLFQLLHQKHFTLLKNAEDLSQACLRPLVALVAIYHDFLDRPSLPPGLLEKQDGLNQCVFREYFSNPLRIYRTILDSK